MKGLEISRRFFFEWGLPWLKREYPDLVDRVAAGRVAGSDIIGAHDKWSRDHDWGPRFRLWLTPRDHRRLGPRLTKEINAAAPERFRGTRYHFFERPKDGIRVTTIDSTCRDHLGRERPPRRARDWFKACPGKSDSLVDRESWLYFFKHGPVFYDPLGEVTARKKAFARYPRDVRLELIRGLCVELWHVGEYKFCCRLVHRKERKTIQMCLGRFVESAMRLCFLLNDDYAPHWVWLGHEFKKLPESRTLGPKLDRLVTATNLHEQSRTLLDTTRRLRQRMGDVGLLSARQAASLRYIADAAHVIQRKIRDKWIRAR